ncbi:hypothetical protein AB0O22_19440 [Streptomyces sp. NPDC091204]|uniref:hypothetical protein n=1 Tax=Streptomyces sp. NPDC091204 TaxID=3155299 RepID=UPI00341BBE71
MLRRSARQLGLPVVLSARPPDRRPEQRDLVAEMETGRAAPDGDVSITGEPAPRRGEHVIAATLIDELEADDDTTPAR